MELVPDEDADNPREWGNLAHLIMFHREGYGDKHNFDPGDSLDELVENIVDSEGPIVWLPIYCYQHGNIAFSTGNGYPFNDPWDAGLIGVGYITLADIRKEWNLKKVSPQKRAWAEELIRTELEVYTQYVSGDVWGVRILDEDGEEVDSCWGLYGYEYAEQKGERMLEAVRNFSS